MTGPIIAAQDVHCTFAVRASMFSRRRPLYALRGVSLSVAKGETVAIVGESGCGKSTLGRLFLGLQTPTSGNLTLAGRPIGTWKRGDRARKIQAVFQDPYSSLNPAKTIAQIVGFPLALQGNLTHAEIGRRVDRMLDVTGLAARLRNVSPSELSGGQRQRVAIARALIIEPEILLCDEPTSALDVSVQSQILNLLSDIKRDLGLTMIFISHNLAVVSHFADRVAVMYLGRIVELRPVADIFSAPAHPYTDGLLKSVLTLDPRTGIPNPALKPNSPDPFEKPAGCALAPRCPRVADICLQTPPPRIELAGGHADCHFAR